MKNEKGRRTMKNTNIHCNAMINAMAELRLARIRRVEKVAGMFLITLLFAGSAVLFAMAIADFLR